MPPSEFRIEAMIAAVIVCVAFAIGYATGDYSECSTLCERATPEADAHLEFRQDDIVLHVGRDSIILDDAIAAAIAMDINEHLKGKQ